MAYVVKRRFFGLGRVWNRTDENGKPAVLRQADWPWRSIQSMVNLGWIVQDPSVAEPEPDGATEAVPADPSPPKEHGCDECDHVSPTAAGLGAHRRKHAKETA